MSQNVVIGLGRFGFHVATELAPLEQVVGRTLAELERLRKL